MTGQRTYWHLQGRGRVPSNYEVATSALLYYPKQGLPVRTPGAEWMETHAGLERLCCTDWERFEDPRTTTYASYTALQNERAIYVDTVFATVGDADAALPAEWLTVFAELIAPLRYPAHALQSVAAYAGSMAPSGRLAVTLALQSADAMRVVQCLAYRLAQLRSLHPSIAQRADERWRQAPELQPWRRLCEHLLAAYDWDEALLALNLVLKPAFDTLFLGVLGEAAARHSDHTTERVLGSLVDDSTWQRDWTRALLTLLSAEDANNPRRAQQHLARWHAWTREAITVSAAQLAPLSGLNDAAIVDRVLSALDEHRQWLGDGELTPTEVGA